ncbi:RHS repeat-associated core domain-containing protein [Salmonella enterica subsp. enterica]|nr:RHS repeat-associated core domain-containing protein [Salmonella enterica subsp. enterica serovar Virchow]
MKRTGENKMVKNTLLYSGQRRSGITGSYFLGNGYRGFNPVLKRFASQDSISPFGNGGPHGFAYCNNDSINNTDISGHGPLVDLILALASFSPKKVRRGEVLTRELRAAAENATVDPGNIMVNGDGNALMLGTDTSLVTSDQAQELRSKFVSYYTSEAHDFHNPFQLDEHGVGNGYFAGNPEELYKIKARFTLRNGSLYKFKIKIYKPGQLRFMRQYAVKETVRDFDFEAYHRFDREISELFQRSSGRRNALTNNSISSGSGSGSISSGSSGSTGSIASFGSIRSSGGSDSLGFDYPPRPDDAPPPYAEFPDAPPAYYE